MGIEQGSIKSGNINVKITDSLGNAINPATQETLVAVAGLVVNGYDYISASYNDGTFTETYVFKTGGSGGTTVATITVVYVDATKAKLVSVTKI